MSANKLQRLAAKLMADRVALPEGQRGAYAIVQQPHKPGDKLMLVNHRVAIFSGLRVQDYTCPKPTVVHKLTEHDGVWMSDLPCELVQMHDELAQHARGTVLVGGLGLGLVARMAARRTPVTEVTVVECSQEVVDLVWPTVERHLEGKGKLIVGDINAVPLKRYDTALLDTWQGTGEMTWTFDVVPQRRRLAHIGVRRVYCWQEGTMLGQLGRSIFKASAVGSRHYASGACAPQYAFASALEEQGVERETVQTTDDFLDFMKIEQAASANAQNDAVRGLAWLFLHKVGTPAWERTFGEHWDAVARREVQP